ncbi:acyl-CoA thioesterase [Nocardia callitridis]|uniref:Acyl-CoA thioesterase II n=1 Tax=Nocardia callitridis TaxID=648753 RepID=A0ABP9KXR6_9NOCA
MTDMWDDLLACLDLRPIDTGTAEDRVYEGDNQHLEYHRLFGGQILGQFIQAARLSCPGKIIKSIHTIFAREGHDDQPVRYQVTRHHEGRSFAALTVVATQGTKLIATASVSMHVPEGGPEHQNTEEVPPVLGTRYRKPISLIPWEIRTADDLDATDIGPADYRMWMRTPAVAAELGTALAAYATDLTLIGTALRPIEGISQGGNGTQFLSAVTSHTLWFHRPLRTDDWLLLRQHSPILANGRCYGRGDMLTEDGALVASYAQEALVRIDR